MSYYRLVDVARQFFDDNGDPLSGGKLYTYSAGTTSNKATYQDNAGDTAHANPIVLDSAGRVPAEVWGTTGAYKLRLDTSADVTVWTRDDVAGINDASASSIGEWVTSSITPTYSSGTEFTMAGDQTATLHVGRRVRWADSGGAGYGVITAASYSDPTTTITVAGDAGDTIDSGLSSIAYGLISAENTSSPAGMDRLTSGTVSNAASLDVTGMSTTYRAYMFVYDNLRSASDNVALAFRLSDDNGATYEADASDYAWSYFQTDEAGGSAVSGNPAANGITISTGRGNQASEQTSGHIIIHNPAGATITNISFVSFGQSATPSFQTVYGAGQLQAAGATTAFRLLFSAGNIASMNYTLYGLRA